MSEFVRTETYHVNISASQQKNMAGTSYSVMHWWCSVDIYASEKCYNTKGASLDLNGQSKWISIESVKTDATWLCQIQM